MRIKEIRTRKKIQQKDLATALGIAPNTLSQYETEKREPDIKTLESIADFLNVSIDYLLGRDEKMPTPVAEDGNKNKNIIKIAGRDGSFQERHLTDEQLAALKAILSQMPDASDYV